MPSPGVVTMIGSAVSGTALTIGTAPSAAMALTYLTMADSIGLAMENATANQQRGQVLTSAAVAIVLKSILKHGVS